MIRRGAIALALAVAACSSPAAPVAHSGGRVVPSTQLEVERPATVVPLTAASSTTTTTSWSSTLPPTTTTSVAPPPAFSGSVWDALADCESGQRDAAGNPIPGTADWSINTGNGYYGGLQFALSSWRGVGGAGYPHEHPRSTQIEMAERLQATPPGWAHWPACSAMLGLR